MGTGVATAAKATVYPHIEKTPDVRGGKPCIAGTRIAVVDVALAYEQGVKPEDIQTYFSSRPLTLAEVHVALAYYYDHRDEIEATLAEEGHAFEEMDRQWEEYAARHGGKPPERPAPADRSIAKPFPWPRKP